jgi:hypothetical protein
MDLQLMMILIYISKYNNTAIAAESVNARLQECIEKARLFNTREFLVGKEVKDYS